MRAVEAATAPRQFVARNLLLGATKSLAEHLTPPLLFDRSSMLRALER